MFNLMGNCLTCIKKRKEAKRSVTFAILGLDNAGKTTTTKGLSGGSIDPDVAPTIGYSFEKFTFEKFDITLFDLGGGKKIRGIWKNYLHEIYGLMFIVDSTASDRMQEAHETLKEILQHPQVSGKPVLLLANKQDKVNAMDEVDICEQLNIENIVNANRCPCRIETCTAIQGAGRKMDKNITNGMRWLMSVVEREFVELHSRVQQAIEEDKRLKGFEKEERRKRVEKERAEREKREDAERKKLGIEEKVSDSDEMVDGDPFKKLDVNEVKKKEEKLREEKRKKKEILQKFEEEEKEERNVIDDGDEFGGLPPISLHISNPSLRSTSNPLLPPLQTPLGTKFVDEQFKRKKKKKSISMRENTPTELIGLNSVNTLGEIRSNKEDKSEIFRNSTRCSERLSSRKHEDDSFSEDSQPSKLDRRKKKKKPAYEEILESENNIGKENAALSRKLQVLPHQIQPILPSISETLDDSNSVTPPSSHRRKKKNSFLKKRVGMSDKNLTPQQNNMRESGNYTLQTADIDATTKLGIVEDLPTVIEENRRLQPNFVNDIIT